MLDAMDPEEFRERLAHYVLEPFDEDWKTAGSICATIYNSSNPKQPANWWDFAELPKFYRDRIQREMINAKAKSYAGQNRNNIG